MDGWRTLELLSKLSNLLSSRQEQYPMWSLVCIHFLFMYFFCYFLIFTHVDYYGFFQLSAYLIFYFLESSHSFVSLAFNLSSDVALWAFNHTIIVEVGDDMKISTSRIFMDSTLDIFKVRFSIDLMPIPMGDIIVVVSMDWLSWFGTLIDYGK